MNREQYENIEIPAEVSGILEKAVLRKRKANARIFAWECTCGGWRPLLSIFLCCFLLYFLRQGLSLNPKLAALASLSAQ